MAQKNKEVLLPKHLLEHLESGSRAEEFMSIATQDTAHSLATTHSLAPTIAYANALSAQSQLASYSSFGLFYGTRMQSSGLGELSRW